MTVTSNLNRFLIALGVSLVAATLAVIVLDGPSGSASTSAGAGQKAVSADTIVISDFKFMPEAVEVKTGAKVTFVNKDSAPHTATEHDNKAFDTGILKKGDKKVVTLSKAGDFSYICDLHPFMKATIKVVG
jgi:plastocyanin